ncbi:hypothetical protein SSS_01993 [Sarcoptes scabiei]|nr:hypothetical protein SSS_01993 [Sarcoptes scabiei]
MEFIFRLEHKKKTFSILFTAILSEDIDDAKKGYERNETPKSLWKELFKLFHTYVSSLLSFISVCKWLNDFIVDCSDDLFSDCLKSSIHSIAIRLNLSGYSNISD